jgi:c-di-GMP-binding flagellar brake protein YcgR
MKSSDLRVNMRLEVGISINQRLEYVPVRIEEANEANIVLDMPMWQGSLLTMRRNQLIKVRLLHRDSYFGFETKVLDRRLKPVPVIVVERPSKIYPVEQRRGYVRIEADMEVRFRLLSDNNNDFSAHLAKTINISAGGMLIASDTPLRVGQILLLELYLPDAGVINCKAKTVRVYSEAESLLKGRVGLQYEDIKEKDRDKIARFVFARQRQLIKKGLLEG